MQQATEHFFREAGERACFAFWLSLGRVVRSAKYSTTVVTFEGAEWQVRKTRRFYAPLLVWMGALLSWVLDAGVRVLPQREWQMRELVLYRRLFRLRVRTGAGGTLVLPFLKGRTLASLLEDPATPEAVRERGTTLASAALAHFHRRGLTHGDAMAENVMVDIDGGRAAWFDFETAHDATRSTLSSRADDVRALISTSVMRARPGELAETVLRILDAYADEKVARVVEASFTSAFRRSLILHLGQAGLSWQSFREIGRVIAERNATSVLNPR